MAGVEHRRGVRGRAAMCGQGQAFQPAGQGGDEGEDQHLQGRIQACARRRGVGFGGVAQAGDEVGQGGVHN